MTRGRAGIAAVAALAAGLWEPARWTFGTWAAHTAVSGWVHASLGLGLAASVSLYDAVSAIVTGRRGRGPAAPRDDEAAG
jgi:hypothetical protein